MGAHFAPVQSFRHDGVNTSDAQSDLGGYGFHCNSVVLGNESSTSWTMSSVMRCGVPERASSAIDTSPSLKNLTLAPDMQYSPYTFDILR